MQQALVIVDMLNDFVDGTLANPAAKSIVAPIAALADRVRSSAQWVVVYANDAHHQGDVELRVFPPHAMAGTPGAAVIDDLHPEPVDIVVAKRYYSAFTETGFHEVLATHHVERVVIVGQHTDCCVRHTSYDAFVRGYEVVVCPDATAVFEPGAMEPMALRQKRAVDYLHTYYGAGLEPSASVAWELGPNVGSKARHGAGKENN